MKTFWGFLSFSVLFFCPLKAEIEKLFPLVHSKLPHEKSFTQGLSIEGDLLYESSGLYGHSQLNKIDLRTGLIHQRIFLPSYLFAEGIALFKDKVIQLTWKERKALIYQKNSLRKTKEISYTGEGWGLCYDGKHLWMSNGSSILTIRNPETFAIIKKISVTLDDVPLHYLNDLECVDSFIYANVWKKEWIVKIDKRTGKVVALIDCSALLTNQEKGELDRESILNGIAFRQSTQTFFLTGKNWKWLFEVTFQSSDLE